MRCRYNRPRENSSLFSLFLANRFLLLSLLFSLAVNRFSLRKNKPTKNFKKLKLLVLRLLVSVYPVEVIRLQSQTPSLLHAIKRVSLLFLFLSSFSLTNLNFMSSLEARTGRLRQRYDENNLRLVSGCIPYRLTKDDGNQNDDIENKIEVVMVSSPNRSDLVFPKGGWENDETVVEAACREALEEAGVKGILRENPLGVWEFRSKSKQILLSREGGCKGYMFALEVTEELESWPEQENHCRKWLNIKAAFELCRYEWMREALEKFLRVMAKEQKIEMEEEKVDPPTTLPLSEVVAECQMISPSNCYVTPSSGQHHSINALSAFPWQITLKRLSLT